MTCILILFLVLTHLSTEDEFFSKISTEIWRPLLNPHNKIDFTTNLSKFAKFWTKVSTEYEGCTNFFTYCNKYFHQRKWNFGCYYLVSNFDFCINWSLEKPRISLPKTSKSHFRHLLRRFPGKLEMTEKNGCDIWIQHPSIT